MVNMSSPVLTVTHIPSHHPLSSPVSSSPSQQSKISSKLQSENNLPNLQTNQQKNILVVVEELKELLELFAKTTYKAKDTQPKVQNALEKCMDLFGSDYDYSILGNSCGELSTNYPSNMIILDKNERTNDKTTNHKRGLTNGNKETVESAKIKELCSRARFARCRARFPVPVILYNQKYICRSATLSGGPEIYGRSSFDYLFSSSVQDGDEEIAASNSSDIAGIIGGVGNNTGNSGNEGGSNTSQSSDWQLFDRVRNQDIRLLRAFEVETIVDLMVEKKKVKFGVNVTSSEKVDKENRYAEFNLVSLPYPGCEFFKNYRDNGYSGEELVFEWNQTHVDAHISVPSDTTSHILNIDWSQYRNWDLIELSQNYLKLLIGYLRDRSAGLLIHCISGWDRTPLFISILRLSLWADGVIHKSLNSDQILYLTIAYDWLLFGHNLEDRLSKGEEILYFCFNFLKYISSFEYSIHNRCDIKGVRNIGKVRNDSDVQLESILLEGGNSFLTPEGSNWSLNSTGSTPSTKSQETSSVSQANQSMTTSTSSTIVNGRPSDLPLASTSSNKDGQLNNSETGTRPLPIRPPSISSTNGVQHKSFQNSNSSASIGSWQIVSGSLMKESAFSSLPNSSVSSRLSTTVEGIDYGGVIESFESSSTLIEEEELTPIESSVKSTLLFPLLSDDEVATINAADNQELQFEEELKSALEESVEAIGFLNETTTPTQEDVFIDENDDKIDRKEDSNEKDVVDGSNGVIQQLCNKFIPNIENSQEDEIEENLKMKRLKSLESVRLRFQHLYETCIQNGKNSNNQDSSTGAGFGSLIGNFASKVGIRAPYPTVQKTTKF